ncbi:threonine ammonia-lyase [soil metagenome]
MTLDRETPLAISLEDIRAAQHRIEPDVVHTPMLRIDALSRISNTRLLCKAESLQRTGSFKARGALNAVRQLSAEEQQRGVVTFSAGNHGQALAWAAGMQDTACTVFMAQNAVQTKVDAIRGYGAEIRQFPTIDEAFDAMKRMTDESGTVFVSPFGDSAVMAGQGTLGLEILDNVPNLEVMVVPVGGAGLLSGVAVAVRATHPNVRIVGVEPEGAPTITRALEAGSPVRLSSVDTIADGLAAPFTAESNLAIVRQLVDDVVLVSEQEISSAVALTMKHTRLLVEPAAAAGVAALITGKVAAPVGAETVVILTGGNIDLSRLKTLI